MVKKKIKIELLSNIIIVFVCISLVVISFNSASKSVSAVSYKDSVYYFGNKQSNYVSLMFNVYWGDEYLDSILEVLDSHSAKVTFFVGGSWADDNKEYLVKFIDKGHEIGNHGYFHKNQSSLSYEKNYEEINATNKIVEQLIGYKIRLFAPPSGDYSKLTIDAANKLNMATIMWSIDTIDWRDKDAKIVENRANKAKGGDLVLMHPTKHTLNALDDILKNYEKRDLKVVTVSENIKIFV